ncbi:MAG: ABC transporter ATP-binding protein [Betaproteobacteria bacterium]
MLTLEGLTKSYVGRRVLAGVDLEVAAGDSVALIGANGCGKTTTLRCIIGLARPEGGRITVGGLDVVRSGPRSRARIGYLPQRPAFPPTLTVRETLTVVARLRRLASAAVDRELEACGLAALADRPVGELSGGERQRLGLAVALLPPADLYLFDEPSANLDPHASRLLFQRARQLKRDGHALLFTTHIPADIRHLATRVALLRNGRIESEGDGAFELRRYERTLEQDMWGTDEDDNARGGDRGRVPDNRLRESLARA